jgi:transposase
MKAYSKDLRLRVLAACDRGMPRKEVAETFGLSVSTVKRYLKLRHETGGVEAKPIPGPPACKRKILEEALPAQVGRNPALTTLSEHCELLEDERGVEVSTATMSRTLRRLGLPLKKTLGSAERDEKERSAFRCRASRVEPRMFVWVDECGAHTSMSRLRGRAPRGQKAYGQHMRQMNYFSAAFPGITLLGCSAPPRVTRLYPQRFIGFGALLHKNYERPQEEAVCSESNYHL